MGFFNFFGVSKGRETDKTSLMGKNSLHWSCWERSLDWLVESFKSYDFFTHVSCFSDHKQGNPSSDWGGNWERSWSPSMRIQSKEGALASSMSTALEVLNPVTYSRFSFSSCQSTSQMHKLTLICLPFYEHEMSFYIQRIWEPHGTRKFD